MANHEEQEQSLLLHPQTKSSCKTTTLFAAVLSLLALAAICSVALLSTHNTTATVSVSDNLSFLPSHVCSRAGDPASCLALLTPLRKVSKSMSEVQVLQLLLNSSVSRISDAIRLSDRVSRQTNDLRQKSALSDCKELMKSSIDCVLNSISILTSEQKKLTDAQTWMSSALTNYITCSDGLRKQELKPQLEDLTVRASTSLAILTTVINSDENYLSKPLDGEFPSWVTLRDRKLLTEVGVPAMNADAVVAKDGSGKYKTVKEAVAAAPVNSKYRYVIWVKKGIYKENVEIPKNKKNLMLTGDGMDKTIITGSLNVVDGSTTFNSATLIVGGEGFIAQDLCIQNTAGPAKHQAVALRVSADQSVINRCRLDAYQDTLYTHTLRQFYRDCTITGTVDFIFGNAAVVFQKCKLVPRKPMSGQGNMVTAQGRTDPNQNTGTSIQDCEIFASSDLEPVKKSIKTYLGRPWKEYSRTVVMQSSIGDVIDPAGWSVWTGDFALKTLYYGEYMNRGPGAGTSNRVKWPGYRVIKTAAEANKFTVASMIQGGAWLKSTGVAYTEGL